MIKVIKPGMQTSLQDQGRFGYRKIGVPYSGFLDFFSAQLANTLVLNDANSTVLEMAMVGAKLQFNCNAVIAICGANMSPKVNGILIANNNAHKIVNGDVLSFGKLQSGLYCYLAVKGGFVSKVVLGSQSFYKSVTPKSKIIAGDVLTIGGNTVVENVSDSLSMLKPIDFDSKQINAFKGPEFDLLSKAQKEQLCTSEFSVSNLYNRMAYQLVPKLKNELAPIITSPVLPGTVQLTPSGQLIVLMRDGQTTGGYPRVLQLQEHAINLLSQKKFNDTIYFKLV